MEGKLQTSFIPKKPLVETRARKTPGSISIFSIIGWFVFIVVILVAGGVYFYEDLLTKSIATKNTELTTGFNKFDPTVVDHFVKLDTRLQAATTLLGNHLAISTLLGLISDNTIQSVQFTDLKYSYDDAGKITLNLSGKAPNFASVALQSDTFSAQTYLQNQVFSNLGLDQDGGVLFKFTSSVDSSAIKYKSVN